MIPIKTSDEIEKMVYCGKALAEVLDKLKEMIKPGIQTIELDRAFNRYLLKRRIKPAFKGYKEGDYGRGFPASICVSINDEVVHGIPGERIIKEGDVVTIDAGASYEGLITDAAFTVCLNPKDKKVERLVEATERALSLAIEIVKEGINVEDISSLIGRVIQKEGFSIFPSLAGHGVGKSLHEDPIIPNFGHSGKGEKLKEGMTLAIEVMACLGKGDLLLEADGWTLKTADGSIAAQSEHTVLVTKTGHKILTALQ
ncbi:MAG: type I methionyl aminopeptidase [Patescibacteria group bacterium]|nr:type I methionyl aminopeptidase [Patescibacteria group bacterium]MCL5093629.1 type I methionyl aminopeptidase [Patescibacteria group bacterium]